MKLFSASMGCLGLLVTGCTAADFGLGDEIQDSEPQSETSVEGGALDTAPNSDTGSKETTTIDSGNSALPDDGVSSDSGTPIDTMPAPDTTPPDTGTLPDTAPADTGSSVDTAPSCKGACGTCGHDTDCCSGFGCWGGVCLSNSEPVCNDGVHICPYTGPYLCYPPPGGVGAGRCGPSC